MSGLRINQRLSNNFFYLINIKKIIFKYNIFSFFKTNLIPPNKIYLDTPTIEFNKFKIPHTLLAHNLFYEKGSILLEIRDGKITYSMPGIKTEFLVEGIDGFVSPHGLEALSLDFEGKGGGDLHGGIKLTGKFDRKQGACDLNVLLNNISITSPSFVPIKGMRGSVHVDNDVITIRDVSFYIQNIPFNLEGTIRDYSSQPIIDLKFTTKTKYITSEAVIFGRENDLKIKGGFNISHYNYSYIGDIIFKEEGFMTRNVRVNNEYISDGDFLLNQGIYSITFRKEKQEVSCKLVHEGYDIKLDMSLNHVSFLGYDLVMVGHLELEPDISFWREERMVLNGTIETDYMIFNYMPLKDFKGTFTISPDKMSNIDFSWSDVYQITGDVSFENKCPVDIKLNVRDLNLENCDSFGGIVMPKEIAGVIEGRVQIQGPAGNPQVEGYLRSGEGRFKQFDFKKITVNFSGGRYMLDLKDSKVYRSENVFYLVGRVDFTKKNIFHDIYLESSEKLILWRGWDLSKNIADETITLKKPLMENINLNVRGVIQHDEGEKREGQGEVSLEYDYRKDKRISISFEEDEDDEIVSLKHKVTF